jgi:hypothetical protein
MREVVPAALRYQGLAAGPLKSRWVSGGVAAGGVIAAALATGVQSLIVASPFIAIAVGGVVALVSGLGESTKGLRALPIAIVPWGIVLDPDRAPVPVPWSGVQEITYTLVQRDKRNQPERLRLAIMTFHMGDTRLRASAEEGEWVTAAAELFRKLARAAEHPPAADLAGKDPLDVAELPAPLALLRRAEAILESAQGRMDLGLDAGNYRSTSSRTVGPETRDLLRKALWNGKPRLDPGPLAAVLIAQLRITELLPDVLSLIMSPSPLLAATARAAALRLGASRIAAGSFDEVALFAPARDLSELRAWVEHE